MNIVAWIIRKLSYQRLWTLRKWLEKQIKAIDTEEHARMVKGMEQVKSEMPAIIKDLGIDLDRVHTTNVLLPLPVRVLNGAGIYIPETTLASHRRNDSLSPMDEITLGEMYAKRLNGEL